MREGPVFCFFFCSIERALRAAAANPGAVLPCERRGAGEAGLWA